MPRFYMQAMEAVANHYGFSVDEPWSKLKKEHQDKILYGSGSTIIKTTYQSKSESVWKSNKPFEGVIPNLERRLMETDSSTARKAGAISGLQPCDACHGLRLPKALPLRSMVSISPKLRPIIINQAHAWFSKIDRTFTKQQHKADKILKEINERLSAMNVGLDYLNLSRSSGTLSGESQRIRLASQIGSGLTGFCMFWMNPPSACINATITAFWIRLNTCAIWATP